MRTLKKPMVVQKMIFRSNGLEDEISMKKRNKATYVAFFMFLFFTPNAP